MADKMILRRSGSLHENRVSAESQGPESLRTDSFDLEEEGFMEEERPQQSLQEKRRAWIRNGLISSVFVLLWYAFSVTLSVYNKWMFSENGLNFNFPVLTTSGHQFVQYLLATGLLLITGKLNKENNFQKLDDFETLNLRAKDEDEEETTRMVGETTSEEPTQGPRVESRWEWFKLYLISIVPCAIASASDIGMGNVSLRFVTLTFYTMVKSSSLAWVLLFGILFKLEVANRQLIAIIGVMTIGVVMMVAGETHFVVVGFLLVLGAAIFSGLRWALTQLLLRGTRGINTQNDPVRTIMYLSPVMGILLFVMGGIIEGYSQAVHASLWTDKGLFLSFGIILLPGVLAFCMTYSEFMLLGRTSVLTLSIAGILKELVTILSASLWFHDRMTAVNALGLVITLSAIVAYNVYRYKSL